MKMVIKEMNRYMFQIEKFYQIKCYDNSWTPKYNTLFDYWLGGNHSAKSILKNSAKSSRKETISGRSRKSAKSKEGDGERYVSFDVQVNKHIFVIILSTKQYYHIQVTNRHMYT